MIPHIDPKVDYAFKRVFGSESNTAVLMSLVNATLRRPPDKQIVEVTIENPFNDKERWDDKLSIVDVRARDQAGRRYTIEMQMHATPAYPERVLYYWAKNYGRQLSEADDYDKLQETISISFLNDVLFPEVGDHHLDFGLRSSRHPELIFSDRQEIHVVELPKFQKPPDSLADDFEAWCYFLRNAAELDSDALPKAMQTPPVAKAMEVLNVISKTDLERERYEDRVRAERDRRSDLKELREAREALAKDREALAEDREALAEQMEKNVDKGIEKGKVIGRILLCQRLLKLPQTPNVELQALTVEALEAMAKALEQQLGVA